jgi:general secretion pathway protein K
MNQAQHTPAAPRARALPRAAGTPARAAQRGPRQRNKARPVSRKEGFALLLSMIALMILAVLVTDLHETTGTNFAAAMAERDQLRAEFLARSGVNLTRMLVAQERALRTLVGPVLKFAFQGRPVPQLPVWHYANMILKPFANFDGSKGDAESAGFDLELAEGLGRTGGSFEIIAAAENGKVNVNDPHLANSEISRLNVASLLSQLIAPPKYDPLFSELDDRGRTNTRSDLVANVVDWWDLDEQRSNYDPTMGTLQSSGGEDTDYYREQPEPYVIKGAPFDTLEELRLVRGMSDDVWATFVEPDLEDPSSRQVTVWTGPSAAINPNEAAPEVLLSRVCAYPELRSQPLCNDPTGVEPGKFLMILRLVRSLPAHLPVFSRRSDFIQFLEGNPTGLMKVISQMFTGGAGAMGGMLGGASTGGNAGAKDKDQSLLAKLVIPPAANGRDIRKELEANFTTTSKFITIESVGRVGHAQRRLRTVVNFDTSWTAPQPNIAQAQPLGVFVYFRAE